MKRFTDTLDHSKILDFNNHNLVDNVAIFTTYALVCYCSRDVSSRRTGVKVRQTLTSYLVVHLTDSTTLTVHILWHSTKRFRNFLAPYKLKGPVIILHDTLPSSRGFKDTSNLNQPPDCTNSILPPLLQK